MRDPASRSTELVPEILRSGGIAPYPEEGHPGSRSDSFGQNPARDRGRSAISTALRHPAIDVVEDLVGNWQHMTR